VAVYFEKIVAGFCEFPLCDTAAYPVSRYHKYTLGTVQIEIYGYRCAQPIYALQELTAFAQWSNAVAGMPQFGSVSFNATSLS